MDEILSRAAILNIEALKLTGLSLAEYISQVKTHVTIQAIRDCNGNRSAAARMLQVHRNKVSGFQIKGIKNRGNNR